MRSERQGGRIHWDQLKPLGRGLVESWIRRRVLIRTLPRVYALGYVRTDLVARIWDAILYAGPGAYLTGASGAHHLGVINYPPRVITVATPWRRRSFPGLVVLQKRPPERILCDGIPVAPIPELMLELAAEGEFNLVRKALAHLDYRRKLDIEALLAVCSKGRTGSRLLRRALAQRLPQLAYTNSDLEVAFLLLLEANHRLLPKANVRLHGILVDAYWKELGLVVELDGAGNHGTAAQERRDDGYMDTLRAHGVTVMRLSWDDVHLRAATTLAQLASAGVGHHRR